MPGSQLYLDLVSKQMHGSVELDKLCPTIKWVRLGGSITSSDGEVFVGNRTRIINAPSTSTKISRIHLITFVKHLSSLKDQWTYMYSRKMGFF